MSFDSPVQNALDLTSGARFYRCALQVNPFEYLKTNCKQTPFSDEAEYNEAIVTTCKDNDIEVIAITDHFRIRTTEGLAGAARAAGIHVFPGFEAVTKDGVHLLCLFDDDKNTTSLERAIGASGIQNDDVASPTGRYDVIEFLDESHKWGSICVAAHVASDGGLLKKLSGQSRANAWRSRHLLACSLPGPASGAPEPLRPILANKNPEYKRDRCIAVVNAQDVCSPEDLTKPGATTWIKMSEVSIEGLRQAFLDPDSRIRLASDPEPEDHAEFVAMAWQGGFLGDAAIHFNENLNVLVGGRGTGKSTVIESLRYVLNLEPVGDDARKAHEAIVRNVLGSATKISLLVRSHRPKRQEYLLERTIPNPPVIRDDSGAVLTLTPTDVIPKVEVYGQHELSELSKSPEKRTRLLERFTERDEALARRKGNLRRELERSRGRILDVRKELAQIEECLASLPTLEEMLKRYQETGLEERLKERSLLVREERVMKTAEERIEPFRGILDQFRRELPIDRAFLSPKALDGLPGKKVLAKADETLKNLNHDLESLASQLANTIEQADKDLDAVHKKWEEHNKKIQEEYEKILREMQKSKVNGEEFIQLRKQIEELRPLKERNGVLQRDLKQHEDNRRNLLAEWEDIKAEESRQLERAAKKVTKKLTGRVRVTVTSAGDREPLLKLLRQIGGRLSEALDTLKRCDDLSLRELADACNSGPDVLVKKFGLPQSQAERITKASPEVFMQIEELDLAPTTTIELNVAPEGQQASWQALDGLSTGQKATALLLLLLLDSDAPLVVDQPEDDLDNRFITESIVPKMKDEKRRRQFVFATHNANIPVLGDAELIVGLTAVGEADQGGRARLPTEQMGSIDTRPVRELVEEVLEGGREAFQTRHLKYGF